MKISKQIEFDYGHRVWTQELNTEYSIDNRTVCRHLHGHRGIIIVELSGDVDASGMITDFKHLNWFKKWVDDNLDHKFLIDESDPLFDMIIPNGSTYGYVQHDYFKTILLDNFNDGHLLEFYGSFTIVNFVPTSENISKWIHTIVSNKMRPLGIEISKITFKETPKTEAVYEN